MFVLCIQTNGNYVVKHLLSQRQFAHCILSLHPISSVWFFLNFNSIQFILSAVSFFQTKRRRYFCIPVRPSILRRLSVIFAIWLMYPLLWRSFISCSLSLCCNMICTINRNWINFKTHFSWFPRPFYSVRKECIPISELD